MAIGASSGTSDEGESEASARGEPAPPNSRLAHVALKGPALRFFSATFLSLYGDWLTTVALLVVLFEATNNPVAPAGYMLVRVAPRVVGPWWGGRLADRVSPRRVLMTASTIQAVLTLSLIALHRFGLIWAIYVAVAAAQFVGAVGRPSQGALVPSVVSPSNLPRANATYGLFFSTSIFVAPSIGALLLPRVGPDLLFAIDAATFAIGAALIATLPRGGKASPSSPTEKAKGFLCGALRQRQVRMVVAAYFASGLIPTVTQAFLVIAAHERFGGDSAVGYLYSSVGVGGVLGGLVALRWVPQRTWTRSAIFIAITIELVATAGFSGSTVVQVATLLLAISAIAGSSLDTWGMTEVQRIAPSGFMGRYNSLIFMSLYTGMLTGALWALITATFLRWDLAIGIACAAMLAFVGLVWLSGAKAASTPQGREP
jgi:MFS family permease